MAVIAALAIIGGLLLPCRSVGSPDAAPASQSQAAVAGAGGTAVPTSDTVTSDLGTKFGPVSPGSVVPDPSQVGQDYVLGPGDTMNIRVAPQERYSLMAVAVPQSGRFPYPKVGEVDANGKTIAELTDELKARLSKFCINPEVSIYVTGLRPQPIYVTGGVGQPKILDVRAAPNVVKAITLAGGVTDRNMLTRISVLRHDKVIHANVYGLLVNGDDTVENIRLQAGDVIIVPTNTAKFTVTGAVNAPGTYPLENAGGTNDRPVHLVDAINKAGGPQGHGGAKLGNIALLRESANGKVVSTQFDYGKFLKNGDPAQNPLLRDNDLVYVPEGGHHVGIGDIFSLSALYSILKSTHL